MRFALAFLVAIFALGSSASQTSAIDEARALLDRARDLTDIRSVGQLYLSASFTIKRFDGTYSGKYQLFWVNEQKWRDEVVMGKYAQIRIGAGENVYQTRTLSDPTGFAASVIQLVSLTSDLQIWPGETIVGIRPNKKNQIGAELKCVVLHNAAGVKYDAACVDPSLGKPITSRGGHVSYSSFISVSDKIFPRDIESTHVSLHVNQLILTSKFPPKSFDLPADAEVVDYASGITPSLITRVQRTTRAPGCYSSIPAQVIKPHDPVWPEIAIAATNSGIVWANVNIGSSGAASIVLARGEPMFVPPVKEALLKQAYAPAQCGQRAISSTMTYFYDFSDLGPGGSTLTVCNGSRFSASTWCDEN